MFQRRHCFGDWLASSSSQAGARPSGQPAQTRGMSWRMPLWIAAAAIAMLLAINVGLHIGQKRHNQLGLDVDQAFPPDKPFISGEIYATTLAELVEHELKSPFGWRPNDIYL